jgi:glycosyltransferase involved in cell wall biosynthesis
VLLIAPSLDIVGGQSVQADRLLGRLTREPSIRVRFLAVNPPLGALRKVKYVRTLLASALYGARLLAHIWRTDVLHIFTPGYFAFYLAPAPAILLARLFGKKTVLNYHDGRAGDHLAASPMAVRILRLASAVVAPTHFLVDVLARFGVQARPIFNFVERDVLKYRGRPRPRPVFLHNRGLEREYNPGCTLRAFALVQKRYPDASLTIAHDGGMRSELEALARELGLRDTRFIGPVRLEFMADLYDSADIYWMSPDVDAMPLSLLECFAAGLPVVSSQVGGVPYLVEDQKTGLLFPAGDHQAMADCALRLLEEPGLAARLAGNARAECAKYDWSQVGPQWIQLYGELAEGSIKPA